jgi:hypothetical protein
VAAVPEDVAVLCGCAVGECAWCLACSAGYAIRGEGGKYWDQEGFTDRYQ